MPVKGRLHYIEKDVDRNGWLVELFDWILFERWRAAWDVPPLEVTT